MDNNDYTIYCITHVLGSENNGIKFLTHIQVGIIYLITSLFFIIIQLITFSVSKIFDKI